METATSTWSSSSPYGPSARAGALTMTSTQAELTGFTTGGLAVPGVDAVSIVGGPPDESEG